MTIELLIEGKRKIFKLPSFISGRMIRKAVTFTKNDLSNIDEEQLDELIGFVANVFGDKFTIDEFYDGIDARKMMETIGNTIFFIINGTVEAASGGNNNPNK